MLARAAADFYWMGRYLERVEHTGRLLEYQLARLVDTPAEELALAWRVIYRTLGHAAPPAPKDADEAEAFLIADAYTLAGAFAEDVSNPDSMIACWSQARENARQLRPWLPLQVWTSLNRGFLWFRETDFAAAWASGPAGLAEEVVDKLRLVAGWVEATMPRDDAWRFLELGRFVERLQHQTILLDAWSRVGRGRGRAGRGRGAGRGRDAAPRLSWSDLLRVCRAYELYCRRRSTGVSRESVLGFLVQHPELPRSLRFSVRRIEELLAGIDPAGARYPLGPPHRTALRLAAAVEMDPGEVEDEGERENGVFARLRDDALKLHERVMATYVNYPVERGLPS